METHEEKRCPRCQQPFICRMGDIAHCQCSNVALSAETSDLLKKTFTDCLCQSCLIELPLVIKNGQERDA
ncbi:MAG: cysteine-rich CWC family protein [Chitinophagaceae bacterium]|nr:cysteine-rich CWC family protein [Chitinophagaceae bacterium]